MFLEECQPLASDSLDFKCTLNGKTVECSKPSTPGTTLTTSCKVTHGIPNGYVESPVELVCGSDGKWEGGQLYQCTPSNICLFYFFNGHSNVLEYIYLARFIFVSQLYF